MLIKARRPKTEISEDKKKAIDIAFEETKLSPKLLYEYCKQKGWVIPDKNKQKKRKRYRYEKHHSESLVHGDIHRTSEDHPYCLLWD